MKILSKRYQYWWYTGEGYALEEFDSPEELLELLSSYPSTMCYVTERLTELPSINLIGGS
jgi:hypothetical protein